MKISNLIKFLFILLIALPLVSMAQTSGKLSNPKPSKEAVALYAYINDMFGKKTLSGQMFSGWGFDEIKYINGITGKYPAIKGLDFIHEKENDTVTQQAISWWKSGGIPTLMWHMGAPGIGEGYENSKKQIDIDKCFEKGTIENFPTVKKDYALQVLQMARKTLTTEKVLNENFA